MLRLKSLAGILLLAFCTPLFADGVLFSLPQQTPFHQGITVPGAKVFFYADGTTTKQAIYTSAALDTELSNPVEADAFGKLPAIFLDPSLGDYKIVIAPFNDTDPPSSAFETVDNYPVTASYGPQDIRFYGVTLDNGLEDDDTAGVQAWLDAGGSLYGATGIARITSQLEVGSNTHIDGRWMKLVHDTSTIEFVINGVRVDNVTIKNLEIDGQKSQKSAVGVAEAQGIHFEESSNIRIENNLIYDTYEHAIRIGATGSNQSGESALYPTVDPDTWSSRTIISGNIVLNCGNSANSRGYGIWAFGVVRNAIFSGNHIYNCQAGGISVDDTSSGGTADRDVFDVSIANNIVASSGSNHIGIRFEGARRGTVTGNVSVSTEWEAFTLQSIQGDFRVGDVTVSGNYFLGGKSAARIVDPTNVTLATNTLVTPTHANNLSAVEFWSNNGSQSNNLKLIGNTVESAVSGFRLGEADSHNTTFRRLSVENNNLGYTGAEAAVSGVNGIYIENFANARITDNTVSGFYNGIQQATSGSSTGLRIKDNDVYDNENYGIAVSGSARKFIEGNLTYDNAVAGFRIEASTNNFDTYILRNNFLDGTSSASGFGNTTRAWNVGGGSTTATATDIADSAAAINTTGKYTDKEVWDSTNNRRLRASGAGATDPWHVVDGSSTITPSP